jgi:hypothetical protein
VLSIQEQVYAAWIVLGCMVACAGILAVAMICG